MKIKIFLLISIIIILCLGFFLLQEKRQNTLILILPDGREISVEIADDQEERQTGLMFRQELSDNAGMFFIFPEEKELSFWMKNTFIPLDIIFLDKDLKILNIDKAEPCQQDPCELYKSDGAAQYVLEINQRLGLEDEGKKIKVKR